MWKEKVTVYKLCRLWKCFSEELVKIENEKKGNGNLKNSTKCLICDYDYIDNDLKERDHCHIARKYRDSAHRNCNINLKFLKIAKFLSYFTTYKIIIYICDARGRQTQS